MPNRRIPAALLAALLLASMAPAAGAANPPGATLAGTLEVEISEQVDDRGRFGRRATEDYYVRDEHGQRTRVTFPGQPPKGLESGAKVRIKGQRTATGVRSEGDITILADAGSTATAGDASGEVATADAPVTRRLAVLLVTFASNPVQPYTKTYATGVIFGNTNSVAAFFGEDSYGKLALTGDVSGWYTISYDTGTCDTAAIQTRADAAATAAGVVLADYTHVSYVFPHLDACSFAGRAQVPGSRLLDQHHQHHEPEDPRLGGRPRARSQLRRPPRQQLLLHHGRRASEPLGDRRRLHLHRVRRPAHRHGRLEPDRAISPQPRLAPAPDGLHGHRRAARRDRVGPLHPRVDSLRLQLAQVAPHQPDRHDRDAPLVRARVPPARSALRRLRLHGARGQRRDDPAGRRRHRADPVVAHRRDAGDDRLLRRPAGRREDVHRSALWRRHHDRRHRHRRGGAPRREDQGPLPEHRSPGGANGLHGDLLERRPDRHVVVERGRDRGRRGQLPRLPRRRPRGHPRAIRADLHRSRPRPRRDLRLPDPGDRLGRPGRAPQRRPRC